MIKESEWSHWPVSGPRTPAWCARFIVENYENPKARHLAWRTQCGLTEKDDGVDTHETAMRFLESLICFGQCQAAELASAELIVRGAQLVELRYREKLVPMKSEGKLEDDAFLYLGTGRSRGMTMVSPEFEMWVAGELSKEAATLKERRKIYEARGFQKFRRRNDWIGDRRRVLPRRVAWIATGPRC